MTDPFLGEVRIVSLSFAPHGWAYCDGQLLSIMQNQALFALLGTFYGGNAQSTFALPDLRGRVPVHTGPTVLQGQSGGEQNHTLTLSEMPAHTHTVRGSGNAPTAGSLQSSTWATQANGYSTSANTSMSTSAVGQSGGSQPHNNMQPFLALNFIIALTGIFPSRT